MPPEGWGIRSPGGLVTVEVRSFVPQGVAEYPSQPRLYYRAFVGGGDARFEMLRWSPLGITRADADFTDDLRFIGDSQRNLAETYSMARGKRTQVSDNGIEQVLSFETPQRERMDLVVRVFDDGFGFCYRFPNGAGQSVSITHEFTGFRMAENLRATMLPLFDPGASGASEWMVDLATGTAAPAGAGWALPALFSTPEGSRWALLTESGVAPGHALMGLAAKAEGGLYSLRFPHPDEEAGQGAVQPSGTLPWATPWRVVILSDRLAGLVESTLVTDLAPPAPAGLGFPPGHAVWPLTGQGAGVGRGAVSLAASLAWGYAMLSATWPSMEGGTWSGLAKEAASKKVGLLIGSREATAVPWPDFARVGLKGARVAVSASGKPEVVRSLLAMLEEARKANQVVQLDGRIAGAGWDRTYPNLLGSTDWRGGARSGARQARRNTIEPFTRNIVGPMEPMPLAFKHASRPAPMTFGHMLGTALVFESGLRTLVDDAGGLPKEASEILSGMPTAWDETRLLDGDPGHTVIIARRKGRAWYIGGLNGDSGSKKRDIPMELVGTGLFQMVLVADGHSPNELWVTRRERNATDVQGIKLLPYGGFLMRLLPQQ